MINFEHGEKHVLGCKHSNYHPDLAIWFNTGISLSAPHIPVKVTVQWNGKYKAYEISKTGKHSTSKGPQMHQKMHDIASFQCLFIMDQVCYGVQRCTMYVTRYTAYQSITLVCITSSHRSETCSLVAINKKKPTLQMQAPSRPHPPKQDQRQSQYNMHNQTAEQEPGCINVYPSV